METDSLSRGFLQRKKIWWWQKRKEERKRKNNYATTIRILWNVAPFILHPRGTNGILRKLSYENAMKLNPRGRSRWRLCSTSLSLSLSLISAVALFSTEKREMFISKRSNGFIEVRRVYLGIYHDVAAAAQLCLFKQREMGQKNKKNVAVSRATGLRTIERKT